MSNSWGGGWKVGKLVMVTDAGLCLCAKHTGDYHCKYIPLTKTNRGNLKLNHPAEFHAYDNRGVQSSPREITEKEYHLLMAGLSIPEKVGQS